MGLEVICGGIFVAGYSVYAYFKVKGIKITGYNKKVVYRKITNKRRKVKQLDQRLNESVGGKKNDTFFKGK